jgi:hypothetical protein
MKDKNAYKLVKKVVEEKLLEEKDPTAKRPSKEESRSKSWEQHQQDQYDHLRYGYPAPRR